MPFFACFIYFLILTIGIECFAETSEELREKSLQAVFSLQCHLEQLISPSQSDEAIAFHSSDVDQLWMQAKQDPTYIYEIEQAQGLYELSTSPEDYQKAGQHLANVWHKLASYPNFDNNPLFTEDMHNRMAPYLLPLDHPLKPFLDLIFLPCRATQDEITLAQAGFVVLFFKKNTYIRLAKHPFIPGYLFKIYIDSELRKKLEKPGWYWLTNRCDGAARIRHLIKKKKLRHFSVPDKWLYPLPYSDDPNAQPVVLMVTDMDLTSHEESKQAWKTKVTPKHLQELYVILSHGSGSWFLPGNVPYSKSGKFAFVDTEYPKRKINLGKVKNYLSKKMAAYWEILVVTGGKFLTEMGNEVYNEQ